MMLAQIPGDYSPRQVERAHLDGLAPLVTGNDAAPPAVVAHYGSLLQFRQQWGKRDPRLLLLFLAVMGRPVLDEYVQSNCIAYIDHLIPARVQSGTVADQAAFAETRVSAAEDRYEKASGASKGKRRGAQRAHALLVTRRTEELRKPTAEDLEIDPDVSGMAPDEAGAAAATETRHYATGTISANLLGTYDPDTDDGALWVNAARGLSDRVETYLADNEDLTFRLNDALRRSVPPYIEIRTYLTRADSLQVTIETARMYYGECRKLLESDRSFSSFAAETDVLWESFIAACVHNIYPDRLPGLGRLALGPRTPEQ